MKRPLDPVLCLNAALVLFLAEVVLLTATKTITFGSERGTWYYSYWSDFHFYPLLLGIGISLVMVPLVILSLRFADRYPLTLLTLWLVAGMIGQVGLHTVYAYTLVDVVKSQYGNTFYAESLKRHANDLLGSYQALAPSLPRHLKANMPGKILLYKALELLTTDPGRLALLLIGLSNLGGVLLYFLVFRIYGSRAVALSSFALYLFIPGKIYFLPLLNIISPVPVLACLLLLEHFLESRRRLFALLLGACLYGSLFFDPLPLFLWPFFAALTARGLWLGTVSVTDVVWLAAVGAAGFAAVHLAMWFGFQFDLMRSLIGVWVDNSRYNAEHGRPYFLWLLMNLVGFFLSAGALSSLVCLAYAAIAAVKATGALGARESVHRVSRLLSEPGRLMFATFLVTLALLDLLGGRGEVERTWVFLMIFLQVVAAAFCCERAKRSTVGLLLGGSIIQTAVTLSMVAFVL